MNIELQEVLNEFLQTLGEVEILLSSAETCTSEKTKYAAYNKSALLLLSGKFENFVEIIAEEYVFLVNNLNLRSSLIPDVLRLHHSYSIISKVETHKNSGQPNEVKKILGEIGSIWAMDINFNQLKIECKFTYGKHGEKELKKLFVPIGIEDIFTQVIVHIPDENITDEPQVKQVDFKGTYNSVIHMRNNILHQNASPNLTHETIREYNVIFQSFAKALTALLDNNLNTLTTIAI